nr:MAG TPA: hypothetical protein [Caudoviricetes sp.]
MLQLSINSLKPTLYSMFGLLVISYNYSITKRINSRPLRAEILRLFG